MAAFKQDPDLNAMKYVFDFDIIPGVPIKGDSQVSAVKLHGKEERYELFGGIGRCTCESAFSFLIVLLSSTREPLDMRPNRNRNGVPRPDLC